MRVVLVCIVASLCFVSSEDDGSFSYHKFTGPVSGQVQEVRVPRRHRPGYTVDYVAKPDYLYQYGVKDPANGNSQVHMEAREGDKVLGEYRVLQPDGLLRIVKYSADGPNGFRATVKYVKV